MKTPLLACWLGTVFAMLFLDGKAFAQGQPGCFQGINSSYPECPNSSGTPTRTGAICCPPGGSCAPPGAACQYCYQGYGACPAGTTGRFTTANWGTDTSCPGCAPPPPTCCNGGVICGGGREFCNANDCSCQRASPVIVDTTGKGFHLTSAAEGVMFDIAGDGHPIKMAWTSADSGNAFLALDRNHNGKIDNGEELFGNFTAQPQSDEPNGFLALAEFDKPENGGNGDGIIDKRDAVFAHLLLWIDENHDGVSQPSELYSLPELGVFSLALHYRDDKHFYDRYGNWFHYQAVVNPDARDGKSKDGRVTYDVFFQVTNDQPAETALVVQSRVSGRKDPWQISLTGGGYWDGILYDDLAIASPRAKKTRCRPQPRQDSPGGTK